MRLPVIVISVLLSSMLFIACQKEIGFSNDNPANPNPVNSSVTGVFKAKFNGTQWVADKLAAAARMNGVINLTGYSNDRKILTISLTDSGVHRYILNEASINAAALIDSTDPNPFALTTNQGTYPTTSGGEVNVTAIDTAKKTISGTFSFKVYRMIDSSMKTISEGSFANLTYSTALPPASSTDTFNVKINGTQWTPTTIIGSYISLFNQITISGTDAAGVKAVGLVLPSNITPGTYTFSGFGGAYIGSYNPDNDPTHSTMSASGTLTILEHNTGTKRIRGNFNFRSEELLNPAHFSLISEGYFSVKYN